MILVFKFLTIGEIIETEIKEKYEEGKGETAMGENIRLITRILKLVNAYKLLWLRYEELRKTRNVYMIWLFPKECV